MQESCAKLLGPFGGTRDDLANHKELSQVFFISFLKIERSAKPFSIRCSADKSSERKMILLITMIKGQSDVSFAEFHIFYHAKVM